MRLFLFTLLAVISDAALATSAGERWLCEGNTALGRIALTLSYNPAEPGKASVQIADKKWPANTTDGNQFTFDRYLDHERGRRTFRIYLHRAKEAGAEVLADYSLMDDPASKGILFGTTLGCKSLRQAAHVIGVTR